MLEDIKKFIEENKIGSGPGKVSFSTYTLNPKTRKKYEAKAYKFCEEKMPNGRDDMFNFRLLLEYLTGNRWLYSYRTEYELKLKGNEVELIQRRKKREGAGVPFTLKNRTVFFEERLN